LARNDNWKTDQQAETEATQIPPANDAESAIIADLPPGLYTAVVAGEGASGVGLIEVYNLSTNRQRALFPAQRHHRVYAGGDEAGDRGGQGEESRRRDRQARLRLCSGDSPCYQTGLLKRPWKRLRLVRTTSPMWS
ncbi:MAG TPA: hypothetical protein VK581_04420, partial [Chthoniobacterales bacterium]|nr:hypothetical protein [Chthoniobacterales bacterium]